MTQPELTVVMPVRNEATMVQSVILAWTDALSRLKVDFCLRVYDDGSRDETRPILARLAGQLARVEVVEQPNQGHGPTVYRGYREARGTWVLQIDSDGEIGPESLPTLWQARERRDYIIGHRQHRHVGLGRRLVTAGARVTVRLAFGQTLRDVNCPYRLMRRRCLETLLPHVPADTFAPNVALAGLALRAGLRVGEIPVESRPQPAGRSALRNVRLATGAARALLQTVAIAWRTRGRLPLPEARQRDEE